MKTALKGAQKKSSTRGFELARRTSPRGKEFFFHNDIFLNRYLLLVKKNNFLCQVFFYAMHEKVSFKNSLF